MTESLSKFTGYCTPSNFYTDHLNYSTSGYKAKKRYFVTGYITSDDIDSMQEIVPDVEFDNILEQLKTRSVKLDLEHSHFLPEFQDEEGEIPYGKILEAKIVRDDGKLKIWVKAELNSNHKRFKEIWGSIQDGYLDGFSIAYRAEKHRVVVEGQEAFILKNIWIKNVALTGVPVNTDAGMQKSFYKSLRGQTTMKKTDGTKGMSIPEDGAHAHTENDPLGEHRHPEIEKYLQEEIGYINDRFTYVHERIDELKKINYEALSDEVKTAAYDGMKSFAAKAKELHEAFNGLNSHSSIQDDAGAQPDNKTGGDNMTAPTGQENQNQNQEGTPAAAPQNAAPAAAPQVDGLKSLNEKLDTIVTAVDGLKSDIDALKTKAQEVDNVLSQDGFKAMANPAQKPQGNQEQSLTPLSMVR